MNGKYPAEPFRIKSIEYVKMNTRQEREQIMKNAGYNTFLLNSEDVYIDLLTDSGTNAMSDKQLAAMMTADDSYAGSETFYRLEAKLQEIFGMKYFLPAHQGRACESIIAETFITKPGMIVPMNYHFTTAKVHITRFGAEVLEIITEAGLEATSNNPFKGNIDTDKLRELVRTRKDDIAFVRLEAGTNLVGGQPVSMANYKEISKICREAGIVLVFDASLLADNLYFIKIREEAYKDKPIISVMREIGELSDIIYFSARKLGCARGGGICLNRHDLMMKMREFIPLYEGFLTYGGMSVREMEAMTVGLDETLDMDMISQAPQFIKYMVDELVKLPGIGINTAASILVYAFNQPEVFVETNVRTVFIYTFMPHETEKIDETTLRSLVQQTLYTKNPRRWYWALMDYGTLLKKTEGNYNRLSKMHTTQSKFEGSNRQKRAQILRLLLKEGVCTQEFIAHSLHISEELTAELLAALLKDCMVQSENERYFL